METNELQFTSLTIADPPSYSHSSEQIKHNEIDDTNISCCPQSKCLTIFLIILSLGLLIVCICLAIALAAKFKSTESKNDSTTSTSTSTEITATIPDVGTCGIQDIQPNLTVEKIFGGNEVIPHSWPWIVLYYEEGSCINDSCSIVLCSGTLINLQYVLTAANCISSMNDSTIRIVAGLHDKKSMTENNTRQIRRVDRIIIHPTYNAATFEDDIAILHLSDPFIQTEYVKLACLPGAEPQVGDTAIIAGWGTDSLEGEGSNVLIQSSTQVVGDCAALWSPSVPINETRQICVANIPTGASICLGDSGDPLLAKDGNQWVVSGVASFLNACNTMNNIPNVFTRVSHYLDWIYTTMK